MENKRILREESEEQIQLELEVYKRDIINAIIQGTARRAHYIFQKPDVKSRLDSIDERLYPLYLKAMAINDFLYFEYPDRVEQMAKSGSSAGMVKLTSRRT